MGMSRKEFTLQVVEKIQSNPRAIFAGHSMNAAVLQELIKRPDVMQKLAVILWSTKFFKKGAVGLKKAANFQIKGYRNFGEFTMKSREDVETFIGGLSPADSATFTNANNILSILMLADHSQPSGDETLEDQIISGKSVPITFDQAVRKEYSRTGGMYLVIMIGDSAARPIEVAKAERKDKINKKKSIRRTPQRVFAELKTKTNKKLAILKSNRAKLEQEAMNTANELEQFADLGNEFGVNGGNPINVIGAINKTNRNSLDSNDKLIDVVNNLSPEDKSAYKLAKRYFGAGKKVAANAILRELNNPAVTQMVKNGLAQSGTKIVNSRLAGMKEEIKRLTTKNESLLVDLALAPAQNLKRSIKSSISRNSSQIKILRSKLGTYKNISVIGMSNKKRMLKETNAAIEANIAQGKTLQQALTNAIAQLEATPQQKQIIKQQVIQQVVSGMPMQFAVQQTLQEQSFAGSEMNLSGNAAIQDIINAL